MQRELLGAREFFLSSFQALTDKKPLRWQRRLFDDFVDNRLPGVIDLPTGLGKTSVIVIWLLALAWQANHGAIRLPRRLVYVVNRRTVVDQATNIAQTLRKAIQAAPDNGAANAVRDALKGLRLDPDDDASPLAISTLRGEFADNREWQADPARPAIIVGTVDMIGSRLLFSGYGISRRMRPLHAGLLGQDALIVHDEAHLTPAFGKLVRRIARLQDDRKEPRPLRVLELSATQPDRPDDSPVFTLIDEDKEEEEVRRRLAAPKSLRFEEADGDPTVAIRAMVDCALQYDGARKRVIVYVGSPRVAKEIADGLTKQAGDSHVSLLTGTIRGHERDVLATSDPFKSFGTDRSRPIPGHTQYLVATSAGEVGVDLDADHMVCDLTTLDSMIQRLGRVNRLGLTAASVHVFELPRKGSKGEELDDTEERLAATKAALLSLPLRGGCHDASPEALRALATRTEAFAKPPRMVELTDIIVDNWSLTSVEDLPGRPAVERWLHGVTPQPPSIYVAWREEVDAVVSADDAAPALKTLFDTHPVLAKERLNAPLREETIAELKKIAGRLGDRKVILVPPPGKPRAGVLEDLLQKNNRPKLHEATLVLPLDIGGLDERGMLDGGEKRKFDDVADMPPVRQAGNKQTDTARTSERLRVLLEQDAESGTWSAHSLGKLGVVDLDTGAATTFRATIMNIRKESSLAKMAETARIVLKRDDDGAETLALLLFAKRGSLDAAEESQDAAGKEPVMLEKHNGDVRREAARIAGKLGIPESLFNAVTLAGARHDLGKDRVGWQKAIGHPPPVGERGHWKPWAKSGQRGFDDSVCGKYRHEFGSLRQASADSAVAKHSECELVLHLIAAHHGWARPHFNQEHWDAERGGYAENPAMAAETMRRFARLQRRFGHWGLAWLEALMRSADYRVSSGRARPAEAGEGELP